MRKSEQDIRHVGSLQNVEAFQAHLKTNGIAIP
jgi:hypothetical protein